jgi:hypothetical protein
VWIDAAWPLNTSLPLAISACPMSTVRRQRVLECSDNIRLGLTGYGQGRKLALLCYSGWDTVGSLVHTGRNVESEESTVLYAREKRLAQNPAMELMISVFLHGMDDTQWTTEELSPIRTSWSATSHAAARLLEPA